ncbi:8521_t:CDS:2 [Rhizophagus irregularis]|nr:8521_t:CDS:2 [Rhizophagus irregularis]
MTYSSTTSDECASNFLDVNCSQNSNFILDPDNRQMKAFSVLQGYKNSET